MRALFVGRFQPFHLGHFKVIQEIFGSYEPVIIIGSAELSHTTADPFTAGERYEMISRSLMDAGIKDFWIIDRYIKDIGVNPKYIQNLKNRFRISFICKEIIRDLIRNGLIPGKEKSNNIKFPLLKNRELDLAFLLGYFDGDGTQKTSKITSGSKIFLEQIKKKFRINHKIEMVRSGGPIDGREVDGVAHRLALGSELFNEMLDNYRDSLPRKRNRFKTEEDRIKSIKENAWNGSHKRKFIISKQELEKLANLMPLYKIGEKFDVSGKTVKKYCTKWGIKIPAHGSWIKKKK